MESPQFRYAPRCSAPDCHADARYKIAARWSNGTSQELKNYGLACTEHRQTQLALARLHRQEMSLLERETVGEIGLYGLDPGKRDMDLSRLSDEPA